MKKTDVVTDKDFSRMKKVSNDRKKYVTHGFYMSYTLRVVLMFISVIVIGFASYYCFNISFKEAYDKKLMYEENGKLNYNVELLPDNPYDRGELVPSEHYISEAVSAISTDFQYNIEMSEQVDVKYTYSILAETEIKNKDNGNVISSKTDTLIPQVEKTIDNTSEINVLQNVSLDYKTYNDNALLVNQQYAINSEGSITIKMVIDMDIKYDGFEEPVKKTQELKATIPLLTSEVNVNLDKVLSNTDMYMEHTKAELTSKVTLYTGIALLIIDVIFCLLVFSFMLKAKPKKSKYCILRDGLLKDYDSIIVNSRSIPKFNGTNIIDCYSFSELLDAQKLLNKPIVYCEIVKNQKAIFMIVSGDDAYKYTLKEVDLDY